MSFKETVLAKLREISNSSEVDESIGHIDDLIVELESIPEDSGWIPVSERLPEEWECVIVCDSNDTAFCVFNSGSFYIYWTPYKMHLSEFWQPLPKPPVTE